MHPISLLLVSDLPNLPGTSSFEAVFLFSSVPEIAYKIDEELAFSFIHKCFPTWYFLMSICILDVKFDRTWETLFKKDI